MQSAAKGVVSQGNPTSMDKEACKELGKKLAQTIK